MTTRRARRASLDSQTARQQILAGAARLFMERGYHATSVREIGEHLDISQSSLYYHAKNKPQILVDLNNEFMSELVKALEEIQQRDATGIEKLELVVHELLQVVAEHQAVVTVVLHERRSLPASAAESVQAQRDRVDAIIDGILQEGIDDGTIRPLPVPLLRLAVTGMTNWAYTWFDPRGSLSADEIADAFVDMLRSGIDASRPERAG